MHQSKIILNSKMLLTFENKIDIQQTMVPFGWSVTKWFHFYPLVVRVELG